MQPTKGPKLSLESKLIGNWLRENRDEQFILIPLNSYASSLHVRIQRDEKYCKGSLYILSILRDTCVHNSHTWPYLTHKITMHDPEFFEKLDNLIDINLEYYIINKAKIKKNKIKEI